MEATRETAYTALGPLAIILVAALVFFVFLFGLYRFLRWLWGGLPSSVLSVRMVQLDKPLGILVALALFPPVVYYAWQTIQSLIEFIPAFIQAVANFEIPGSCGEGKPTCLAELSQRLGGLIGATASRVVVTLKLTQFPVAPFVWFLLTSVIAAQVIGFVLRQLNQERLAVWSAFAAAHLPASLRQRIVFTCLVLVSFYFGLSALLAIAVFQDKSRSEQLTVEALGKALNANIIPSDVFEKTFPANLPTLREAAPPQLKSGWPASEANAALDMFGYEVQKRQLATQDMQAIWTAIRSTVMNEQSSLRDQATNIFSAGRDTGGGGKQTAKHYYNLLVWHQQAALREKDLLNRCGTAASVAVASASQSLQSLRATLETIEPAELYASLARFSASHGDKFERDRNDAYDVCRPLGHGLIVPERPSVADMLGPIGNWTRWLLDTDQMPVVIIVGLVGFSLMGATVSRAVRLTDDRPMTGMTLDDLLIVVAGGTTAAVVVFLAAYGGLALLGSAGGDPNPYIVFVTCLIGAVYSEDVWSWARNQLRKSTADAERSAKDKIKRQVTDSHTPAE
jgi:hypothetical protein